MKNLEVFGVEEMNKFEMQELNGGADNFVRYFVAGVAGAGIGASGIALGAVGLLFIAPVVAAGIVVGVAAAAGVVVGVAIS